MWVLILFGTGALGSLPSTSIPGYRTEQLCSDAGKEYAKRMIGKIGPEGRYICIPGPGQPERPSTGWVGEIER